MHAIIEANRKALEELCRQYHVRSLSLFGSALGDEFEPGRSDVDFAVQFEPLAPGEWLRTYFGLVWALERLFGTKVDLTELDAVRNPYFRNELMRTRQPIYG
ncbi:MAG: hypothetical protein EPN33_00775 [Acidobacteria bacterium]|nr:MAG: hypothetical protein EPN33_00775 [Acidobacteriota bacterium]